MAADHPAVFVGQRDMQMRAIWRKCANERDDFEFARECSGIFLVGEPELCTVETPDARHDVTGTEVVRAGEFFQSAA
jgi:hypothetical protein